jgi:succinoglycan biosynthesis protein ExoA
MAEREMSPFLRDPEITIIMPIRNERPTIEAALDTTLGQVSQGGIEVMVVDGMSEDGTREILERRAGVDSRMRVLDNPMRLTAYALNIGLAAARGAYWVRFDGHSVAAANYAERLVAHIRSGRCECAGGVVRGLGDSPFGRAVAAAHDSLFGIGNSRHHYETKVSFIDHVTHGAYRLDISRQIGGFDEAMVRTQDFEFDVRYRRTGARIMIDPSVVVNRRVRETPGGLARQYLEYGYWKGIVTQRHPDSMHLRWLVPPALALTLAVQVALSWTRLGERLLAATIASYAFVLLAGAITLGRRIGFRLVGHAALALATMHLAYGYGYLWSAIRRPRGTEG